MARLNDDAIVSLNCASLEIPLYLDEISASAKANQELTVETFAPPLSLKKQPNPLETMVLRIEQSDQPAGPVARSPGGGSRVARRMDRRSPEAAGRPWLESGAARNWPLVDLLDQVADRFDLVAQVDGTKVRFSTAARTDAKPLAAAKQDATKRASESRPARRSESSPGRRRQCSSWATAKAIYGKAAKAAIWYERLIRNAPASAQVAPACFNVALLHARNHEHLLARETWFRVIDYVPGPRTGGAVRICVSPSLIWKKKTPKRPSSSCGERRCWRRVAHIDRSPTLLLAAAHLQKDEPANARLVLAKFRTDLFKEPYRPTAMFLDAYAEYRLAKSANGGRREASELLDSLWNNLDDNPLGPLGDSLIARSLSRSRLQRTGRTTAAPGPRAKLAGPTPRRLSICSARPC